MQGLSMMPGMKEVDKLIGLIEQLTEEDVFSLIRRQHVIEEAADLATRLLIDCPDELDETMVQLSGIIARLAGLKFNEIPNHARWMAKVSVIRDLAVTLRRFPPYEEYHTVSR